MTQPFRLTVSQRSRPFCISHTSLLLSYLFFTMIISRLCEPSRDWNQCAAHKNKKETWWENIVKPGMPLNDWNYTESLCVVDLSESAMFSAFVWATRQQQQQQTMRAQEVNDRKICKVISFVIHAETRKWLYLLSLDAHTKTKTDHHCAIVHISHSLPCLDMAEQQMCPQNPRWLCLSD